MGTGFFKDKGAPGSPYTQILPEGKEDVTLSLSLQDNLDMLQDMFSNCSDIVYREFVIDSIKQPAVLIFISGLADTRLINQTIMNSLMNIKEAFTESIYTNTALVRRKIKSPRLKSEEHIVGRLSRTKVYIAYLQDIADDNVVKEVRKRIAAIDVDSILESGYIEELIEDTPYTVFPQIQHSERPDKVAAAIMEGRVAVLVDGTPFVLIIPGLFIQFFQSSEDYYERFTAATAIRIIRFIFTGIALLLPGAYVAVILYHKEMIPTQLFISIIQAGHGTPFPILIEALIMEISFEALREAGIRLPGPANQTVGIVGALIIGDAAVRAGIVSPTMVIIISITGVASLIETSKGKTVFHAIQNFVISSPVLLDFSHVRTVVISKEFCEAGISDLLDYLNRERQFRSTNWFLVSDEKAGDILSGRIKNEDFVSIGLDNFMKQYKKNTSIAPVDMNDLIVASESEMRAGFVPVVEIKKAEGSPDGKINIEKIGVFKSYHLKGVLAKDESRNLPWLLHNSKGYSVVFPFRADGKSQAVTLEVFKKSSKITPYVTEDGIYFRIECQGHAILREVRDISITTSFIDSMERNTEAILEREVSVLIDKAQKELKIDFFGFSEAIYNNYPAEWHDIKSKWNDIFPDIKYEINFKIDITKIGLIKDI